MDMLAARGTWEKLTDGTWGIQVRAGGKGAELVGRMLAVVKKDKSMSTETLGEVVTDYGPGDVVIFRVASKGP